MMFFGYQVRNITFDPKRIDVEYLHLPYLGESLYHCPDVTPLWHCAYWDGPINGVCEYQGKKCWFETVVEAWYDYFNNDEGETDYENESGWERQWGRRYVIFELTPEEIKSEEERHQLFREHVGWHTDYVEELKGGVRPREGWSKFYDWAKVNPPCKLNLDKPLAWLGFPDLICGKSYLYDGMGCDVELTCRREKCHQGNCD